MVSFSRLPGYQHSNRVLKSHMFGGFDLCCKDSMPLFANKVGQYWFAHIIRGNEVDLMIS